MRRAAAPSKAGQERMAPCRPARKGVPPGPRGPNHNSNNKDDNNSNNDNASNNNHSNNSVDRPPAEAGRRPADPDPESQTWSRGQARLYYPATWTHGWSKHGSSIIPSKQSIPQDLYSPCLNLTDSARTMFTPTMFSRRRIIYQNYTTILYYNHLYDY